MLIVDVRREGGSNISLWLEALLPSPVRLTDRQTPWDFQNIFCFAPFNFTPETSISTLQRNAGCAVVSRYHLISQNLGYWSSVTMWKFQQILLWIRLGRERAVLWHLESSQPHFQSIRSIEAKFPKLSLPSVPSRFAFLSGLEGFCAAGIGREVCPPLSFHLPFPSIPV